MGEVRRFLIMTRLAESKRLTQKEIKGFVRDGLATDITSWSEKEIDELGNLEIVDVSLGQYVMNGALFQDRDGNLYAVTSRSSILFHLV